MKIIYASNSDLGKHGNIGFRTFQVAKEAYKRGYLDKIIVKGNKQNFIPKKYIKFIFPFYRLLNLFLTGINQSISARFPAFDINLKMFDFFCKRKLNKCDIFHIYDDSVAILKKSHEMGNINILDTQMAHPVTSYEVQKEYRLDSYEHAKKVFDLYKKVHKYADYIICSSDFVIDSFIKNNIPKNKLIKLLHGVDINKFKKIKNKKDKFCCLYVGILTNRKGIKFLLNAWTKLNLKNAELILCGRLNKDVKSLMKKYMKNNKNIKYKGFVNPLEEYQNADLFVFPSLFESSAKVLYEAMACELPIITTPNAGPPFKDKTAGFIVPIKNSGALAEKIKKLYLNKKLREKMGKQGREIVKNLSWENYGKKMNDIYEKIRRRK